LDSDDLIAKFHELLGPSLEEEIEQTIEDTSNALINFHDEIVDKPIDRDTISQSDLSTQSKFEPEVKGEEDITKHMEAEDAQAEFDALMRPRHRIHWEEEFIEPHTQNRSSQDGFSAESDHNSGSRWEDEVIELEREASQDEYAVLKPTHPNMKVEKVTKPLESAETIEDEFTHSSRRRSQIRWEEEAPEHDWHQRNKIPRHKYPAVPERKSSIGKDDWFKALEREEETSKDYTTAHKREPTIHNDQDTYDANKTEMLDIFSNRLAFHENRPQFRDDDESVEAEETREALKDYVTPTQMQQISRDQRLSMPGDKRQSYNGYVAPEHRLQPRMEKEIIEPRVNGKSNQNGYITPERQISPRIDSIKRKELVREQSQSNGSAREYTRSPLRTEVPLQTRPSPPAIEKLKQEARIEPRRSRDFQQPQQTPSPPVERLVIRETLNEFIESPRRETHHQLQQSPVFPLERSDDFHGALFGEVKTNPKPSPKQSPTLTHNSHRENQQSQIEEDKMALRQSHRQSLVFANGRGRDSEKPLSGESKAHPRPSPKHSPVLTHQSVSDPVKESPKTTPRHSPTQEFRRSPTSPLSRNPPSPMNSRMPHKIPTPPLSSPTREQLSLVREDSASQSEHQFPSERKKNMVSSFPDSLRNEVKSPVHEFFAAPKLGSIEEMIEKVSFPVESDARRHPIKQEANTYILKDEENAHTTKDQAKPYPSREEVKTNPFKNTRPSIPENMESTKDKNLTDYKTTERKSLPEDEEHDLLWAQMVPPKSFKMRKSKKIFTTRY